MMSEPLVSVVMTTRDRRRWLPMALGCFMRQTYRDCELIVVDDGDDFVGDLIPPDDRIRYVRTRRMSIGAKWNLAIGEYAIGEIITFQDDDDWMASWRIWQQLAGMRTAGGRMSGTDRMLFWDLVNRQTWEYNANPGRIGRRKRVSYVVGASMMFERPVWEERPFVEEGPISADTDFVRYRGEEWINCLWGSSYVATIHPGNTSPRRLEGEEWKLLPGGEGPAVEMIGAMNADWFVKLRQEMWP